jgi:hypothetical protein
MESATGSSTNNAAADWFKKGVFAVLEFSQNEIDNVKTNTNAKLTGKCLLCKSLPVSISGRKTVTSNFLKHVKVG